MISIILIFIVDIVRSIQGRCTLREDCMYYSRARSIQENADK